MTTFVVRSWPSIAEPRLKIGTLSVSDAGAVMLVLSKPHGVLQRLVDELPSPLPFGGHGATVASGDEAYATALKDYVERRTDWAIVLEEGS